VPRASQISARPLKAAGRGLASLSRAIRLALQKYLRRGYDTARPMPGNLLVLWRRSPKMRRSTATAALVMACGIMVTVGWQWMAGPPQPMPSTGPEPEVKPMPTPIPDPFTIQVAAYWKPEDAQRFVDHLKQNHVEAFSNKAVSANRTWYQVKVSHFATKDEAVKYGEMLKAKGLIDDYYVANYSPGGK